MNSKISYLFLVAAITSCTATKQLQTTPEITSSYNEPHRPQIHFTPRKGWMNDPNGMLYYNDTWHLFFQHNPDSTIWGPMHWGHAISKDLVHWQELPIALYPDSLGTIFSGSAVADINNTSGFGKNGKTALVAIFTHHNEKMEKAGSERFQYQSLAYSLDDGKTWTKYENNPVLQNPGIRDFRDPKVMWYEPTKKWIMTLATLDHITFYSSPDLKNWKEESTVGKEFGAHGGVWECPDLFSLNYNGQKVWVLLVNINPGGPNGGSATQYFTGQFDGNKFTPYQTDTRWLDYGPDEYAGITWSNTGDRKVFFGWMSNWQYANVVPTEKWRSATTIPRDLGVEKIDDKYLVTSRPAPELNVLNDRSITLQNISAKNFNLTEKTGKVNGPARLKFNADKLESFTITLSNDAGEKVIIGYDKALNNYFVDRTNSGKVSFEKGFARKHTAPRLSQKESMDMTLIIDNASVELFADNGLSVMTAIFFPNSPNSNITINSQSDFIIKSLTYNQLRSIWM